MASMDYQEAKREITKLFRAKDSGRKVIFWYDPPINFKEDILSDIYDCCQVLLCDKNEFSIKKTIEHDEPNTDFLVYFPYAKPDDADNWLLDMLLYSEEYYADTVALTMRRLGLSDPELRRVVERYAKFFDEQDRNRRLNKYVEIRDGMPGEELKLGMLCTLARASSRSIESVLTELVFNANAGTRYAEIRRLGFEEFLWDEIARNYNYEGDQKIEVLIRRFLFTAFLEQTSDLGEFPSFYSQYTIDGVGRMDAKFFVDKLKSDKRYPALQDALAKDLKIEGILTAKAIESFRDADIFSCVDQLIIKTITQSLKNASLDYDYFAKIISSRINSIWYETYRAEYELLSSTLSFYRVLDNPIPKKMLATDYIHGYTESYYLMDLHYRHICASYRRIERPTDEFEWLMVRIEQSYQTYFLEVLGKEYSDALAEQQEWRFPGIPSISDFYYNVQRNNYRKCFVIISDGLRYEIARELFEKIQADPVLQGSEELTCAVSALPSETRFGKASLLPHKTITYDKKAVFVDDMPTELTSSRDAILKKKNSSYAAIGYEEINGMSRADLRSYMADKSLVYIYHDVMDTTGEHSPKKVFDVAPAAINELLLLVRKLFNSLQISNFYITADHGFLYRCNTVEESSKYGNIVSLHTTEASKRYVITDDSSVSIPYTLEFPLSGDSSGYKVITPYSYDLFMTRGAGLQYIHGGHSLQETVVPIIHIGELNAAKNKEISSPVGIRLKSLTRKITNRSFSLEFEQYEKVEGSKQAVNCEAFLIDESGNRVSGTYPFMAASTSDDPAARVTTVRFTLMNIQFDRNKRYYLILRDIAKPNEYIAKEQFVIDILAFKVF